MWFLTHTMGRKMFQADYHSLLDNTMNNFIIVVTSKRPKKYMTKFRKKVKSYEVMKWRASVECGISWSQLTSLIQEVLIASNPERQTGFEKTGQLPNIKFVRR